MQGRFRAGDSAWGIGGMVVVLAAGVGGCGTDSFAPPPPEGLRNVTAPVSPQATRKAETGVKSVELILAPRDEAAAASSAYFAKTQGGYDGVLIHAVAPDLKTTPAGQVDLVAAAIKEKPPVLIVEPAEKPDSKLAGLVEQARGEGIPVVLIGPPLEGVKETGASKDRSDPKAPLVRVVSEPFQETARRLVKSALRVAKNAKVDPKGGAILFFNDSGDPYMNARVAAVREALKEEGITSQTTVTCTLEDASAAEALKSALEKDPKATLIFPFDLRGFSATLNVVQPMETRDLVTAGYNTEEKGIYLHQIPNAAALAEFRPVRLMRRAVQVAQSLMRGEKVEPVVEVPINFTDSGPNTGAPELKATRKKKKPDLEAEDLEPIEKK